MAALSVGKEKKVSLDCITISSSESLLSSSSSLLVSNSQGSQTQSSFATSGDGAPTISSTTSSVEATSPATTVPTIPELSSETDRKSAEEVLNDFLDLSITTNYDQDP